ncbi:STAS domain-containing protein [Streptantibioticus rubrisoli]|uniref:STAS domain-containing protein n=1 Tax=Streptantibioticus rubrisoli TaxID=1387313 RepID=A0ABT1P6N2_9ACTN|nr:STAS domain-containing protein [Streptantibioticus rubrisoli]MCQ4041035.1 STAS domain-containing protein [Streptantibioticus rubrisoli]
MTIQWRYTNRDDLGILSLSGYLGTEAVARFAGAVGWALARGKGPVILDLTALHGWSPAGQVAVLDAARRLAEHDRALELAAIPADGSIVPAGEQPPIAVHCDLATALTAHQPLRGRSHQEWRTADWAGEGAPPVV